MTSSEIIKIETFFKNNREQYIKRFHEKSPNKAYTVLINITWNLGILYNLLFKGKDLNLKKFCYYWGFKDTLVYLKLLIKNSLQKVFSYE